MNPSQVLLGESFRNSFLMNFFPKVMPLKYAMMSFTMMQEAGKNNQKMPLKMLGPTTLSCPTIRHRMTTVHASCPTWTRPAEGTSQTG
jgi:hypothetical protein